MTDAYAAFAAIYDAWQEQFHPPFWQYVLEHTRAPLSGVSTVLDLACGTGAWSIPVAAGGAQVFAVDGSAGMLRELRRKRGSLPIHIQRAPLTDFHLPVAVDLAGCFFDSLNHLLHLEELEQAFRSVATCLRPGGRFLFDLNNEACFQHLWQGHFVTHARNYSVTMISRYDEMSRRAESDVVVFLPESPGNGAARRYRRVRSLIRERCFTSAEVRASLTSAGFAHIREEAIAPFPEISSDPMKTWWSAVRE